MDDIEIGTFEAKNKLSSLVRMAASGKKIWITNRGRRVALLSSGMHTTLDDSESLINRLSDFRKKAKIGKESLKSLIEEGHK